MDLALFYGNHLTTLAILYLVFNDLVKNIVVPLSVLIIIYVPIIYHVEVGTRVVIYEYCRSKMIC